MKKTFSGIIVGTGGQGQITLLQIIAQAAKLENLNIITSELHGLSQKGGQVEVHFRFGQGVLAPLVKEGEANLIIALERQESLRACYFGSKEAKTLFLVNDLAIAIPNKKPLSQEEIAKDLKKFSGKVIFVPATEICQKEFNAGIAAGVFLVSLAAFKNVLGLKPASVKAAIKKIVKPKYIELNLKIFDLAKNKAKEISF